MALMIGRRYTDFLLHMDSGSATMLILPCVPLGLQVWTEKPSDVTKNK